MPVKVRNSSGLARESSDESDGARASGNGDGVIRGGSDTVSPSGTTYDVSLLQQEAILVDHNYHVEFNLNQTPTADAPTPVRPYLPNLSHNTLTYRILGVSS
jgi:hypothetical protein